VHLADSVRTPLGDDAVMEKNQQESSRQGAAFPGSRSRSQIHLRGRRRERETLDRLVSQLWAGRSQTLVVRGEEGVGKTALLDYLAEQAAGCRVLRAAGVESEHNLAFAGLHQMCAPFLDRLDQLPQPQREVLATVFGLSTYEEPDRFAVGMAVMSLLRAAVKDQPLVCILNDAQWFDEASAQTVGFVARRLVGVPVAIVISVSDGSGARGGSDQEYLAGVPELPVPGLSEQDALAVLRSTVPGPFDARVHERIATEARGNPMALRQATSGQDAEGLAGGFGLPRLTMPARMERTFKARLDSLPAATRRLLLLAAADPTGDAVLLWSAANHVGIGPDAAAPAEASGLVTLDGDVRFCHPLVRSVIYQSASPLERRRVHRVLADVTDAGSDPDRRAWHRAHAADLDEEAAAELEQTAELAQARGGLLALSAFRARAAVLTGDPGRRARRALTAAEMNHQAGAWKAARRLLAMAQSGPLDEAQHARVQLLRARLAARSTRGADTPMLLCEAAVRIAPEQPGSVWQVYNDAFTAALKVGHLGSRRATDVATAVRAASVPRTPDGAGLLLEGASVLALEGHGEGAPLVKQALDDLRACEPTQDALGWLPLACRMAQELWDDRTWHLMSARLIELASQVGALALLPEALNSGAVIQLLAEGYDAAVSMAEEADTVNQATRDHAAPYGRLMCAAWRGSVTETSSLIDNVTAQLVARGEGAWLTATHVATAVVNNGSGRYAEALAAAELGSKCDEELGMSIWAAIEQIEAAVRLGAPKRAADALRRLSRSTEASATDWGLGVLDRSQALLNSGATAERLHRSAIDRLGRTLMRADLGRAHLLYGEWLRREGRRVDARHQLRTAHELLAELGFEGFAERARRELVATGGSPRKRTDGDRHVLTAQEAQIARMAREGHTNSAIGAELFISPRTVEWHLRSVFTKLDIRSRRELSRVLPS
jgi:DNA-binding CsgD family transcriptional regulator